VTRTEDGAGLGLAIVRAITEAHAGQAHATNAPSCGADVWITLPSAPHISHEVRPRPMSAVS
jgi:signal transduction histidine kinase